ncbi:hypothetical protein TESG_03257 [Trichophyton tonsurans CBS 112818]|uniref:DUF8004 domain-containing protein n=1 Tax=Trichophyton tonsurans (strain CBS 112818) TaxID=647933 RepID=F2RWU2_TRIT1|nr:hypothetical protein TESG_03257 [Trichophyton tonsurans CBS 112818]
MLATPSNNPVRRLSSFFSLGSPKPDDKRSPTKSPHLQSSRSSSLQSPPSRDQQLAEETQALSLNPRNVSAPVLGENAHQTYTPPPRLSSLNPDLAGPGSPDIHSRSQSWSDAVPRFSKSGSRPGSGLGVSGVNVNSTPATISKSKKGAKSKLSGNDASNGKRAWIAGTENDIPYDISTLLAGERVADLWDDAGDTYVYLFPQNSGRPPSFKVDSAIFSASASLTLLARGTPSPPQSTRGGQARSRDPNSSSPPLSAQNGSNYDEGSDGQSQDGFLDDESPELHLYMPVPLTGDLPCRREQPVLSADDVDMLVLFRNLFAFLIGQALIATPRTPSIFNIFMEVSGLLDRFGFTNLDQSTFGETATSSFGCYCDELDLIDVRASRERALDAIILGERMKYLPLYQEGFTHGVAVLDDLKKFEAKYNLVSAVTRKRLERGYLDLDNRIRTCAVKIDEFEFPSLFSGIANSNVANEAKVIRFKNWKNAYLGYRKNVMNYYRARFGSWPPKASKKNQFQESGLNRLVLRELYQDFCDLYDMLADRTDLTTRSADMTTSVFKAEDSNSTSQALRQIMSEYDRSTPPVQPPIPFDIPRLPSIHSIRRKLEPKREAKERAKRLTTGEVNEILVSSYNHASMKPTPFLENFMNYERRVGHGKCADELADMRCAQWLFMYAVIQSLPMLVVDAPDLRCTHGVEYFLCIPPWGGSPWCASDPKNGKKWFGVAGGSGVVNLPSDVVANGVDAVYRRSHCWQVALKWADEGQLNSSVMLDPASQQPEEPQQPPPPPPVPQSQPQSPQQQYQAYPQYPPPPQPYQSPQYPQQPPYPAPQYPPPPPQQQYQPYAQPYQQPQYPPQQYQHYQHPSLSISTPDQSTAGSLPPSGPPTAYPPPNQAQNFYPFPYPPPLSSTGSSSDRQPTPLLTPGDTTPPNLPMLNLQPPSASFGRGAGTPGNRSSIYMGLEALPLPAGVSPVDTSGRSSTHNPDASFDHILQGVSQPKKKKK